MVLYSRTFTVTNCDSFTRNFLTKLGVRLNDPVPVPADPYTNLREEVGFTHLVLLCKNETTIVMILLCGGLYRSRLRKA